MKNILLAGAVSVLMLTACKKDDQVAEKSLEQQKIEFQQRQLEIEKQKLAIEKERMAYETQKKADSVAEVQQARQARASSARTNVVRETRTVYVDNTPRYSSSGSNTGSASNTGTVQQAPQKQGMSHAAKGTIVGAVTGAAAGALLNKKSRGGGAVVGGIIGGATGYTIGRSVDRKQGRVPSN
jgi:hypothetical protein